MEMVTKQHMEQLRALLPDSDLETVLPMEAYEAWEEEPAGMTNEDFTLTAMEDIRKVRNLAMTLRKQTGQRKAAAKPEMSREAR